MALTAEQRESYGRAYIQNAFNELVGRPATDLETARFFPAMGNDPNIHDVAGLRAQVAQFAMEEKAKQKPIEDKKIEEDKAGQYKAGVADLIKKTLGRDATDAEAAHFATMKAQGTADDYTIGEALKTLPEYTSGQDKTARDALRSELSGADTSFLQEKVFPALQSQFAQQGRTVGPESAGLSAALANAAKSTNDERERYLATIGHEDYTNQRQQTINNYLNNTARAYQVQDQNTARAYQTQDQTVARSQNIQDYLMQQRAYSDYLLNYGRRGKSGGAGSTIMGGLQGGMSGAAAGFMVGGAPGAIVGGVAGAGLGAYGASQQRSIY